MKLLTTTLSRGSIIRWFITLPHIGPRPARRKPANPKTANFQQAGSKELLKTIIKHKIACCPGVALSPQPRHSLLMGFSKSQFGESFLLVAHQLFSPRSNQCLALQEAHVHAGTPFFYFWLHVCRLNSWRLSFWTEQKQRLRERKKNEIQFTRYTLIERMNIPDYLKILLLR